MGFSRGQVIAAVWVALLCCSLAAVAVVGGVTAASDGHTANADFANIAAEQFEADRTLFEITVFEGGDARWTFRYEQRLESDQAIEDFQTYATRFNDEETESYRNFRARAISLTDSGSGVTERNMTAEVFDRDARIEERSPGGEEFAVIEMSFNWTQFAERDADRLVVGDVFVDGLYVGPDQVLRFERGPELRFDSVEPEPDSMAAGTIRDSETVSWVGEVQFTDRHPRLVYVARDTGTDALAPDTEPDPDTEPAPDTDTGPFETVGPLALVGAISVVFLLGAGVAIAYRSGRVSELVELVESVSGVNRPGETHPDEGTNTGAESVEGEDTPVDVGATDDVSAVATSAEYAEEFRSDEDRVVALLETQGGRMKQVDIVNNTNWSKSKVSMLLSDMEDEGTISKLRVGRENIVSLAGHEPEAAGSPFDDGD